MRIKTPFINALNLSSLWSDLSCAAELVIAGAPTSFSILQKIYNFNSIHPGFSVKFEVASFYFVLIIFIFNFREQLAGSKACVITLSHHERGKCLQREKIRLRLLLGVRLPV